MQLYVEQAVKKQAERELAVISDFHGSKEGLEARQKHLLKVVSPPTEAQPADQLETMARLFGQPGDVERIRMEKKYVEFTKRKKANA